MITDSYYHIAKDGIDHFGLENSTDDFNLKELLIHIWEMKFNFKKSD